MSETPLFRRHDAPLTERVDDLLARLTLPEKVAMLHQHQPAIDRLGIAAFRTGTEGLHGVAWLGEATVFPQAIGLATSWDLDLLKRVGAATSDQVRALHQQGRCGLNVWAPVVNPLRDPRWGRNEEGYAEDPLLSGLMGDAYARGLAGDHPRVLRTAPTLKHFLGYNNETDRCLTSSNLSPRVLHEYELPAYRPAIERGSAVAVMASYNLVNGRPAHVTPYLEDELRTWTGDEIFVVSDAYAPTNLADPMQQAWFADHAESHAAALRAGIDSFTDADQRTEVTVERITEALRRELIKEEDVDRAVRRALTMRVRLGEFDSSGQNPYGETKIDEEAHRGLAKEAARASITLLKSECCLLPLDPARHRTVAVVGPHADRVFTDWYSGTLPYAVTARAGLAEVLPEVVHAEGADRVVLTLGALHLAADEHGLRLSPEPAAFDVFDWGGGVVTLRSTINGKFLRAYEGKLVADSAGPSDWVVHEMFRIDRRPDGSVALRTHSSPGNPDRGAVTAQLTLGPRAARFTMETIVDGASDAADLAATADAVIVVIGNHPLVNGRETEDRADLELPSAHDRLLREVYAANRNTALVLVSSYPYAIGWADTHLPAVLWMSHAGQELGHALADVLTGRADPGGRLTQTWYRSACELPDILDYDIITNDATYQYYRGTPLYPFGHGLSYASFDYSNLDISHATAAAGDQVTVTVWVTNTGRRAGTEVVQLYTHQQVSRVKQPLRRLRAFGKVGLEPGESRLVRLTLDVAELAFWDVTSNRFVVETARHKILVGRSASDIRLTGTLPVRGRRIGARRAVDSTIRAGDHDEYSGITLVATGDPVRGEAVRATEDGAWCCFNGTDLSRVRAVSVDGSGPPVALRLDDPYGEIDFALVPPGETVSVPGVEGVHDLYLAMDAGSRVSAVTFRS
ncbi:glycoside hydrolase family 3 C-terminal domain-containing protein [Actinoplanes bogorensis]|uniref:Glycoside hydrolase family 3 C-terminal domain-containing protein n=1 Tax=Paractinoplanes bogorensis TaxID=1610840 RepID=A0ABS5Z3P5_9ACTN|nr:glycoside hydrolase family 3 protein [Actinoplanes bogorensis]MBU2670317.1 glycoside hydrolase family 3 C-terminal domain-containing protein [Actinoplanes bogorensis]